MRKRKLALFFFVFSSTTIPLFVYLAVFNADTDEQSLLFSAVKSPASGQRALSLAAKTFDIFFPIK